MAFWSYFNDLLKIDIHMTFRGNLGNLMNARKAFGVLPGKSFEQLISDLRSTVVFGKKEGSIQLVAVCWVNFFSVVFIWVNKCARNFAIPHSLRKQIQVTKSEK